MNHRIARLPELIQSVGLSKPTIYKLIRQQQFPAPIKIGPKASGWLVSEIDAWIAERAAQRDHK